MPDPVTFRSQVASIVDKNAALVRARHNQRDRTYEFVFQPRRGVSVHIETLMHASAILVNEKYGPGVVMPRLDHELPNHFCLVAEAAWFAQPDRPRVTDTMFVLFTPLAAALLVVLIVAITPVE